MKLEDIMRKWGFYAVLAAAAAGVACSPADQHAAHSQAQQTEQQARKDLHEAGRDARQGFDKANRAVTNALDEARQEVRGAVQNAKDRNRQRNAEPSPRDSGDPGQR